MQLGKVWGKAFGVSAAIWLVSAGLTLAQTPPRVVLTGHRPEVVSRLQPLGRLEGLTQLKLSIYLPMHNLEALTNLLEQIYDPASPQYHHYLTPQEFDARFGPTEADYQSLIAWAERNGLTVTARHSNRLLLEVRAPVADIERALEVTLRTYAHPAESRTFYAPDTDPSVAVGLPVASIGGLDNFARPHPQDLRRTPLKTAAKVRPEMGSGPNGNLAGSDFQAAYAPGVSLTGAGQQVGLVEFDGYYPGDVQQYEYQTGQSSVAVQTVLLDGFDGNPTTGTNSSNGEVALDIEMAISMAPALDQVVVFEAGPNGQPNDVLQAMSDATNSLIRQFSCSWIFGQITPAQQRAMDRYFQKFAAQGQSFFAASGDNGNTTLEAPSDDPYVTIVGGTTLATTGPGGAWLSETAWNAGQGPGVYATGGGISSTYPLPAWQQGVNLSASKGSTSRRNTPDVAMVADNIFLVADNGYAETTGGTSAAAPLWAGFAALINEQAANAGQSAIGFLNPAIYRIGTSSGYGACFDDVTVGNNTNNNASEYLAVPGYDLCTGWGSPSGSSLILALTQPDGLQITPGRGAVANGQSGGPFSVSTQTFALINSSKTAFDWSLSCDSDWLDLSSSSGTLAPGTGTNVTVTVNSAAGSLSAGVYSAGLSFANQTSGQVQFRQFTLQVDQELVQDGGFEAGDFCYWNLSGPASVYNDNYVDDGMSYSSYDGNYEAILSQVSTLATLSQTLPTRPGQYYLLSFWLANPANPYNPSVLTPNQFQVQWNPGANTANVIFNQVNFGNTDWTNLQFTVLATSSQTTLQFAARNDQNFFALDSVSVTPLQTQTVGVSALILNDVLNAAGVGSVSYLQSPASAKAADTNSIPAQKSGGLRILK